ncbi:MAG: transposase [Opitutales bacterium]
MKTADMNNVHGRSPRFRGRHLLKGECAVYHVMSRTSCGQKLFGDREKALFMKQMRRQAAFSGVELLAYCIMGNHFHLLVEVPEKQDVSDEELLRRYRILYGKRQPPSAPKPEVLEAYLKEDGEMGRQMRERLLARMHDLSAFMRELKQRFGIWYNQTHKNKGTIWAERFKSVLVERSPEALSTVAAYIDLNPVRAQLVGDPIEYHFCSYARAMGGEAQCRCGYERVYCFERGWQDLIPGYRIILYGKGSGSKGSVDKDSGVIEPQRVEAVLRARGKVSLPELLRLRVRYFSDATALGSKDFLGRVGEYWRQTHGVSHQRDANRLRHADWGPLHSYRNLQVRVVSRPGRIN